MLMRFFKLINFIKQKAEIVFDIGEIGSVLSKFKVMARGYVLDQSAIKIVFWTCRVPKILKYISESLVITAFQSLIVNLMKQILVVREKC